MAGGAGMPIPVPGPGGLHVAVVCRDLALLKRLMCQPVAADKARGHIKVRVPGAATGGGDLVVQWLIDADAWNQQGKAPRRSPPDKEAA